MLEAIRSSDYISDRKQKKSLTNNPFYNEAKKKNSEYRKNLYRKIKGSKIDDNRRNL